MLQILFRARVYRAACFVPWVRWTLDSYDVAIYSDSSIPVAVQCSETRANGPFLGTFSSYDVATYPDSSIRVAVVWSGKRVKGLFLRTLDSYDVAIRCKNISTMRYTNILLKINVSRYQVL